jgi:predicted metalloprotease
VRRVLLQILPLFIAFTLGASACATEATFQTASIDEPAAPDSRLGGHTDATSGEVVKAAISDVSAFWQRTYEDLYGTPFQPISGGFWPYGPDTVQPPCGQPEPTYRDIAGNAFYCPGADLIAWDEATLIPELYDEFGGFTIGIVLAHEFGHAIQARAGTTGNDTVVLELQADCFAGAWARDVEEGNAEHFDLTADALDEALAGFLALRDGVGTSAEDPRAHGAGFDRIGSFVDGYESGVNRCAAYPEDAATGDLVVVEVPYERQDDYERGGNLPLDELGPILVEDLEGFWTNLFEAEGEDWTKIAGVEPIDAADPDAGCEDHLGDLNRSFYCVDDNTIYVDEADLIPALNEIGDYAVATEIARAYAFAAQARLGSDESTAATNLNADCLTGFYASSGFYGDREDEEQALTLSPGDLDEAVIAFLLNSDAGSDVDDGDVSVGTAFQRFRAYRDGFISGLPACNALLED